MVEENTTQRYISRLSQQGLQKKDKKLKITI